MAFAASTYAADSSGLICEFAPLKAAYGQVGGQLVYRNTERWGVGVGIQDVRKESDRSEFEDRSSLLTFDALLFPRFLEGLFAGVGILYEREVTGRQEERAYVARVSPDSDARFDRWTNIDDFIAVSEIVGYRYRVSGPVLVSLAARIDQLVWQNNAVSDEDIYSLERDTASRGRPYQRTRLSMGLGVEF